ncbi:interleukin-1 receptor-associated kinase 4-like [Corticium candelabrum]|uniref:interleukin-1 receptor-associated kinase 4-like n=1 Tax=Corticium candelabrum TaxID=121492 RepID=UPI002E26371B|nr:interleukin-1 receptor-associated kinase 4-like [Corticium candelabrum]
MRSTSSPQFELKRPSERHSLLVTTSLIILSKAANLFLSIWSTFCCIMHYNFPDLQEATDNFNATPITKGGNKLGEGGFGPVFKGRLRETEVAIKLLKPREKSDSFMVMGKEQFVTEIEVLAQFRHPNLITLMGYSCNGPCPCLIYEFMDNGTLEDKLDPKVERKKLTWSMRLSIMNDAARGIVYLHTANRLRPFIHRDIKSANVLLDSSMKAKVGDFGLVRSSAPQAGQKTTNVMGTSGYLAPEYLRGEITIKLDTYSFGVVVFEVLTGLAPFDPRRKERRDLISYLEDKLDDPAKLMRFVDKLLIEYPWNQALEFARIAALCVEPRSSKRPTMEEVYKLLKNVPFIGTEEYERSQQFDAGVRDIHRKVESNEEIIKSAEKRREKIMRPGHLVAKPVKRDDATMMSLPGNYPMSHKLSHQSLPPRMQRAARDMLVPRGGLPGEVVSDGSSEFDKKESEDSNNALGPLKVLLADTQPHDIDSAAGFPYHSLDSRHT